MSCSLDCKKFGMAAVAAFAAFAAMNVMGFLIHGVALKGVYHHAQYAHLWNPEAVMASRRPAMLVAFLVFSVLFTKIYTYGFEFGKPGLGQGLRYGALV